ncbi:S41 family peptidase [Flavobacterium anhuiense]|uniref:S41 family peptidase n=1 Tax=Flavobacterium anhuiense TaxID=459526 RepID=UPI003D97C0CF
MKKVTLLCMLVFCQVIFSFNKITETEKLAATCKVWGFLKYYHPAVASGELNWDNQLLEKLPLIEKAQTKEEFSLILENWIDDLGPVKEVAPIIIPKDVEFFDKNFDLSWFNNKLFSKKLSKKLKFIEENRFQSEEEFGMGFDALKKTKNYFDLDYTNKGSRMVMLFAYWNLIEYYFPYKYVMDQKWDITLEQALPMALENKDEDSFYLTMRKLAARLNDSHARFAVYGSYAKTGVSSYSYFPARGKIIDNKIVITEILGDSLAQADNIKIGTVITKIGGKTIKELVEEKRNLISASNEAAYLDRVAFSILISEFDKVNVEFLKDGKYETKAMTWFDYHDSHRNEFKKGAIKKKEKFKLLDNNIGYVDMGEIKPKNVPDMIEALKATKAIVFDMRNYPNDTWKEISDFLNLKKKDFVHTQCPI